MPSTPADSAIPSSTHSFTGSIQGRHPSRSSVMLIFGADSAMRFSCAGMKMAAPGFSSRVVRAGRNSSASGQTDRQTDRSVCTTRLAIRTP